MERSRWDVEENKELGVKFPQNHTVVQTEVGGISSNNPGAPDVANKFRSGGKGNRNIAKCYNGGGLDVGIVPAGVEEPYQIDNSRGVWIYRDEYVGHDRLNSAGRQPSIDL